ncbi:MAG: hypothetical protein A2341_19580 [Deltaproteobacteria bacterium RIFOXYB12_FULL_58_9]|nr:MAG: hypothetical protein A2341_19580 [Deltaproteobacteria bacterium RIFOXYB12_FULL_58_9]
MVLLTILTVLSSPVCDEVTLEAEIGAYLQQARGTITCAGPQAGIQVATYPGVLSTADGIDDINREWFYPAKFDPAAMHLAINGRSHIADGPWLDGVPAAPGGPVTVEFSTRVPNRNGTLGVRGGIGYLLGGWHPAFGAGEEIPSQKIQFRIRVPAGVAGFVGDQPVGLNSPRVITGEHSGRFVPILLAPAVSVMRQAGVTVIVPQTHGEAMGAGLRDLSASRDETALGELSATLADGFAFAGRFGLTPAKTLLVVVAPLREHLVERFDEGFAVSDRMFHLLPFETFLALHRLSIWREQLTLLAGAHCQRVDPDLPASLISELVGSALTDRLAAERYGETVYAPELLETFAVIPEIDSLIFAPQVAFRDTYFSAIDESSPRRWRLDNFFHSRPRGKLLYEKMIDKIGVEAVSDLIAAYVQDDLPLAEVTKEISQEDLLALWAPWLGRYPEIDYAIGEVRNTDDTVEVMVEAHGPAANTLREPITVEVVDGEGGIHRVERLGPGMVSVPVKNKGPAEIVEIDPEGRLVELAHEPGKGPRFNNRTPPRWRFLLNNIASLIAVTNEELTLAVDFSLRRIHDLEHRLDFFALYDPSSIGAATTYSFAFGEELTPLRLAHQVGASLAYERLRSEFTRRPPCDGPPATPGDQLSLFLFYRYDDRLNSYWAFEGKGLSLRLGGATGWAKDGAPYQFGQVGVSGFYIWQLAFGHAVVGRLRGDMNFGETPIQDALSVGDLYRAGRGFERDEARGDARLVMSTEYRHLFIGDARTDLGGILTWTRLEGALFADAVYMSVLDPIDCDRSAFFDVGYGLRFIGEVMGVTPAAITVDFGVPLGRCVCEESRTNQRAPVTVYVGFVQSFSSF